MIMTDGLEERALQYKYGVNFPGKVLCDIQPLLIPATSVRISYKAEEVLPIGATTEFLLKFIDAGLSRVTELEPALGFPRNLLESCLSEEIDAGHLVWRLDSEEYELSAQGRTVLQELSLTKKVSAKAQLVFNRVLRKATPARVSDVQKSWDGQLNQPPRQLLTDECNRPPNVSEFSVKFLSQFLARASGASAGSTKVRVLDVVQSRTMTKGFIMARLLVWLDRAGKSSYLIEASGERDQELENALEKLGGLEFLGIRPTPFAERELEDVRKAAGLRTDEEISAEDNLYSSLGETRPMPDGGSVLPAEHRGLLERALVNSRERLLISSPWVSRWIVSDAFITSLEKLLEAGTAVTIAWGFDDPSGRHKSKSDRTPLQKLLNLASTHSDNFALIKMDQSHQKILISDGLYVCTSHNWLSYGGNSPRIEWGEKRTDPDVVDDRYFQILDSISANGHPMTEDDLPPRQNQNRPK
jgi:hypothetical protein